jgi:hypothetical protein
MYPLPKSNYTRKKAKNLPNLARTLDVLEIGSATGFDSRCSAATNERDAGLPSLLRILLQAFSALTGLFKGQRGGNTLYSFDCGRTVFINRRGGKNI